MGEPKEVTKDTEGDGQGGVVALGVVFAVFALVVTGFIGFLIYRERTGNPSFGPRVSCLDNGAISNSQGYREIVSDIGDSVVGVKCVN